MFLNSARVSKVYLGGTLVVAAYFNGQKVWPMITQAMIDAYIAAVQAKRGIDGLNYANNGWHLTHDRYRDAMRHFLAFPGWGVPWNALFYSYDTDSVLAYLYDGASHSPGYYGTSLSYFDNPSTRIVDIITSLIDWAIGNLNPSQAVKDRWRAAAAGYQNIATWTSEGSGDYNAQGQWNSYRATVGNYRSSIPQHTYVGAVEDIIDAAKLLYAMTHRADIEQAVVDTAKAITDLGGTLPTVP